MKEHTLNINIGDKVYYQGRIGIIKGLSHIFDGTPAFDLIDEDDEEQTCTAIEDDCITIDNYWTGDCLSVSGIQY